MDSIDINNILIDTFNTSIDLFGQDISVYDNNNTFLYDKKAIVTPKNIINTDTTYQSYVSYLYQFAINGIINYNYTIVYNGKKYKVDSINDTKPYKVIYAKYYGIADVYDIVLSETSANITKGGTYQIQATCYKNSEIVSGATVYYTSKDTTIATVTDSGLVTGIEEGTTQIVCSYMGVIATLDVAVTDTPTPTNYKMVVSDDNVEIINPNENGYYNCDIDNNNMFFIGLVKDTDTTVENNWINIDNSCYSFSGDIRLDKEYKNGYYYIYIRTNNKTYTSDGALETITINYNNVEYSVTFKYNAE